MSTKSNNGPSHHHLPDQLPLQRGTGVHSLCALCRSGLRGHELLVRLPSLFHKGLYRMPRAYGLVKEIHSVFHRIVATWKLRYKISSVIS